MGRVSVDMRSTSHCLKTAPLSESRSGVTYEQAVAVCEGGLTALPFLRDKGRIAIGKKVLINGASGSVGTAAVQIARYFGAETTAVCSARNIDLVSSLGADHVIDYAKTDFTRGSELYDIIFDTVGKTSFDRCKAVLRPGGVYLNTVIGPKIMLQTMWTSKFGDKKAAITCTGLRPANEKVKDLQLLMDLLATGTLTPVIDRVLPLEQAAEAYAYIEKGHKIGNVILSL